MLGARKKTLAVQGTARVLVVLGGAGGIRTRGGFNPTHAFQACDLNRSSTAPLVEFYPSKTAQTPQ